MQSFTRTDGAVKRIRKILNFVSPPADFVPFDFAPFDFAQGSPLSHLLLCLP